MGWPKRMRFHEKPETKVASWNADVTLATPPPPSKGSSPLDAK